MFVCIATCVCMWQCMFACSACDSQFACVRLAAQLWQCQCVRKRVCMRVTVVAAAADVGGCGRSRQVAAAADVGGAHRCESQVPTAPAESAVRASRSPSGAAEIRRRRDGDAWTGESQELVHLPKSVWSEWLALRDLNAAAASEGLSIAQCSARSLLSGACGLRGSAQMQTRGCPEALRTVRVYLLP